MSVPPSPLLNDLYQLTMMQGYRREGLRDRTACFDLFFRVHPFRGGFSVAAGLEEALRFLRDARFSAEDLDYLDSLGLFGRDFLDDLASFRFSGTVHAVPEGSLVFPLEPILRVQGPLDECQLVESTLLNILNFQSLIATKAARICQEAGWDNVMEFGLRRAQGIDGALTASRAAYIGGCASTSNVLAGKVYGIPVKGTHAHSWVMAFESELEAFRAYARVYPKNTILLVDTYDTLGSGVPNAVRVGLEMRAQGERLAGIRLDSGDLAYLSVEARRMLDEAGLTDAKIVCSSDLDEHIIHDMKSQGARIDLYGVGTNLVSASGDPAFSGVYKIAALRGDSGAWDLKVKISEGSSKSTLPGVKQVWRLYDDSGGMIADWMELEDGEPRGSSATEARAGGIPDGPVAGVVRSSDTSGDDPTEPDFHSGVWGWNPVFLYQRKRFDRIARAEKRLLPVFSEGRPLVAFPSLPEIRRRVQEDLGCLHPTMRRLLNPHIYKVSIGPRLREATVRLRTGGGD